jgi:hypothetical protein
MTALIFAVQTGHVELATILIEKGAVVNAQVSIHDNFMLFYRFRLFSLSNF